MAPDSQRSDAQDELALSFAPGISMAEENGALLLATAFGRLQMPPLSAGLRQVLETLGEGHGATERQLAAILERAGEEENAALLFLYLHRFDQQKILARTILDDGKPLITSVPASGDYKFALAPLSPERAYVLSRFAYLHREEHRLILESPCSHAKLILHDPRVAAWIGALAAPRKIDEDLARAAGLPASAARNLGRLLIGGSLLIDDEGEIAEVTDPVVAPWSFHDLLFHARSRMGRHSQPIGKTFPFLGRIAPYPAVKPAVADRPRVSLHRPDLETLIQEDPAFTQVLEERRSIREQGEIPIRVEQLGELLFRAARVRSRPDASFSPYEITSRPYPGGGACYELEIYVTANACEGLASGLYLYEPELHELHRVAARTAEVERLLTDAAVSSGSPPPQVLITLAARFQRVSWSYEGIAYSVILKNVGALYQTLYLVATAMGLAPCALGRGDSDLFARAAGTQYLAESSVGELMLGTISQSADLRSAP
ncbi:MAG TPA: SagB family peptide dehydrogenase [Thermoanaerobaculia bacterium]|nr:SagB family peptide dehydrogenase [Thermoanaerobaculia bacterium]